MMQPQSLSGMTIGAVQRHVALAPLEVRILLSHVLGLSRTQLITRSDQVIDETQSRRLMELFSRRLNGEPIAYLVGEREFYGLPFLVTPDVLIPRPETELLVDLALARLPHAGSALDMGTGSGAIAVALAYTRPDARVSAIDFSPAALVVAQENAGRILDGAVNPVEFLHGNWYAGLESNKRFDLIVANPPYIAADDVHLTQGDLRFEPPGALTDGADGLSALESIIAGAQSHLHAEGWLLLEHGYDQAENVRKMLINFDFIDVESWSDLAGIPRVSGGKVHF